MDISNIFIYLNQKINKNHKLHHYKDWLSKQNITLDSIDKKDIKFSDETYVRNVIYRNENIEILVLCWKKGQKTPIHNHPEHGCLLQILQGKVKETHFKRDKTNQQKIFGIQEVSYMHDSLGSHQLENIEDGNSITLHIYSPPNYYN